MAFLGSYPVRRLLETTGTTTIHLADDPGFDGRRAVPGRGSLVVIEVLDPTATDPAPWEARRDRFYREAATRGRRADSHRGPALALSETDDGRPFLVMPFRRTSRAGFLCVPPPVLANFGAMENIGRFWVKDRLLRTDCASVYLCRDPDLEVDVAVRVFEPTAALDGHPRPGTEFWRARVVAEARTLARLDHPHVAALREMSATPTGLPYFVVPFVTSTLARTFEVDVGPFPVGRAVRLLREILSGLAAAHERGIVHGALAPSNVLMTGLRDGSVKLAGFGLGEVVALDAESVTAWTAEPKGPGAPPRDRRWPPDERSDVHAAGVLAYRMLTGQMPGGSLTPPHGLVHDVPAAVGALVMRALADDPLARPSDGGTFLRHLAEAYMPWPPHGAAIAAAIPTESAPPVTEPVPAPTSPAASESPAPPPPPPMAGSRNLKLALKPKPDPARRAKVQLPRPTRAEAPAVPDRRPAASAPLESQEPTAAAPAAEPDRESSPSPPPSPPVSRPSAPPSATTAAGPSAAERPRPRRRFVPIPQAAGTTGPAAPSRPKALLPAATTPAKTPPETAPTSREENPPPKSATAETPPGPIVVRRSKPSGKPVVVPRTGRRPSSPTAKPPPGRDGS